MKPSKIVGEREAPAEEEARDAPLAEEDARRVGRPSLSGGDSHSPQVSIRVPEHWEAALKARAEQEHLSRSALVRKALAVYLGVS